MTPTQAHPHDTEQSTRDCGNTADLKPAAVSPTQAPYKLEPPFEIYHDSTNIADKNGHICNAENPEIAEAILAVLTAAAEAKEKKPTRFFRNTRGIFPIQDDDTAAAEVGETNLQMLERLDQEDKDWLRNHDAATIERCAQVAEQHCCEECGTQIAAAIRKLKDDMR